MNKKSLWNILSGHFIVSSTIPFLIFAALVYIYTVNHFRDSIEAKNNSSAKLLVSIVEEKMNNIQLTLQNCAKNIENNKTLELTDYLQAITIASQAIHKVRLLDKQGIVYAQSPYSKDALGLDMSNYPAFKFSYSEKKPYWSPSIISERHRTPVFQISIPLRNGVLIADVTFPNLNTLLKGINLGNQSILAITDQTGTYIAHSNEQEVQQRTEDRHFNLFKNISGTDVEKISIKNDKRYNTAYAASIGPSRWVVLIYQNSADVYRNLITYTIAFTTIALVILFLAMLVLMLRFKTITLHFNDLLNLAARVSRGDYNQPATHTNIKEFAEIATAFEKMSDSIQAREREMQKLRSQLSNIINSMPSVLIAVNSFAEVIQWNSQAEIETGLDRDQAAGLPLEKVYPKLASKMKDIHAAIEGANTCGTRERLTHQRDGRTYYEDITIYPLDHKDIKGAVIRLDDVTDKVHLEQIMVQSEKMMSLGGLAAGMAHEINNPLAGISGNVYNINKRLFGDLPANRKIAEQYGLSLKDMRSYLEVREIPKMIESIKSSTMRASTIVRNMLSFSRKSEMSLERYDLTQLLDETIDIATNDYDLETQFDFKKINIIREYGTDIPKVYCERVEIQQVFFNLLKNGAEAMKDKEQNETPPGFTVRVFEEGNYVAVQIEDNGPGMDEDVRSRIFEPFYTTKPVGKGTGLGLSVSYFIITEQHGGTMTIDSNPGHWTRFTIKLPVNPKK